MSEREAAISAYLKLLSGPPLRLLLSRPHLVRSAKHGASPIGCERPSREPRRPNDLRLDLHASQYRQRQVLRRTDHARADDALQTACAGKVTLRRGGSWGTHGPEARKKISK